MLHRRASSTSQVALILPAGSGGDGGIDRVGDGTTGGDDRSAALLLHSQRDVIETQAKRISELQDEVAELRWAKDRCRELTEALLTAGEQRNQLQDELRDSQSQLAAMRRSGATTPVDTPHRRRVSGVGAAASRSRPKGLLSAPPCTRCVEHQESVARHEWLQHESNARYRLQSHMDAEQEPLKFATESLVAIENELMWQEDVRAHQWQLVEAQRRVETYQRQATRADALRASVELYKKKYQELKLTGRAYVEDLVRQHDLELADSKTRFAVCNPNLAWQAFLVSSVTRLHRRLTDIAVAAYTARVQVWMMKSRLKDLRRAVLRETRATSEWVRNVFQASPTGAWQPLRNDVVHNRGALPPRRDTSPRHPVAAERRIGASPPLQQVAALNQRSVSRATMLPHTRAPPASVPPTLSTNGHVTRAASVDHESLDVEDIICDDDARRAIPPAGLLLPRGGVAESITALSQPAAAVAALSPRRRHSPWAKATTKVTAAAAHHVVGGGFAATTEDTDGGGSREWVDRVAAWQHDEQQHEDRMPTAPPRGDALASKRRAMSNDMTAAGFSRRAVSGGQAASVFF